MSSPHILRTTTSTLANCRRGLLAIVAGAAILVGCGSPDDPGVVAGAGELGHIHDLVITEDETVLAASHTGLWRIEDSDRAVLVGTERHDLMAMAGLDDGTLLVSGHPDLRVDAYHVDDHPRFLGLTRSDDGGETWQVMDLLGEADFHALVSVGDRLYGAETTGRIWRLDSDGSWTQLGELEARDLAVDPSEPDRHLAPDNDGKLWTSSDGAATWARLDDAPAVIEVEWPRAGTIVGVGEDGTIWRTSSVDAQWTEIGSGPADIETFHIDSEGRWWLTAHGGAIVWSEDEGGTWVDIYSPPARP